MTEPTREHLSVARQMRAKARTGWYLGTRETLDAYAAVRDLTGVTTPELSVRLLLSRDKMHHSVGWWRNVDYEYCWHLSLSAKDRLALVAGAPWQALGYEELPAAEVSYWSRLIFGEHHDKLWNEPGGTDPRLTRAEARRNALIWHLRLFLHPDTMEPFIPHGEVYTLTRWHPTLTPGKADR